MSGSHHHHHFSGWNFPGDGEANNLMHSSGSDFVSEFFGSLTPDFSAPPAAAAAAAAAAAIATDFPVGGGIEEEVESSGFGREQKMGASTSDPKRTREDDENRGRPPKRKRNRTTEMHNMTERRRRDKIKGKLKALQELIPNSHKLDKATLLDEAITYVKALQQQIQIMQSSGMYHSSCVSPGAMHCLHMPHFSPFSHMGLGYGMGMTGMSRSPLMSMPSPVGAGNMVPMPGFSTVPTYCSLSQPMPFASLPEFSMSGMMPLPSPPVLRAGPFSSHRGEASTQEEAQNQEKNASDQPISSTC